MSIEILNLSKLGYAEFNYMYFAFLLIEMANIYSSIHRHAKQKDNSKIAVIKS